MECKHCRRNHNNGTNFCTKKCRGEWIRIHNIKGAKKKALKGDFLPDIHPVFDYEGNSYGDQ